MALLERVGNGLGLLLGDDLLGAQKRLLRAPLRDLLRRPRRARDLGHLAHLLGAPCEGALEHLELGLQGIDLGAKVLRVLAPGAAVVVVVGRRNQQPALIMRGANLQDVLRQTTKPLRSQKHGVDHLVVRDEIGREVVGTFVSAHVVTSVLTARRRRCTVETPMPRVVAFLCTEKPSARSS